MIEFSVKGDLSKTKNFLERSLNILKLGWLDKYGKTGVDALASATPKDTGTTAESWYYQIKRTKDTTSIEWCNRNQNDGIPIAILIQYGHAFQNGVYVEGIDFINPSIKPVFNQISEEIRKELNE